MTMRLNFTRYGLGVAQGMALGVALLGAAPVLAQTAPDPVEALLRARGEAYHRAPDAEQDPEELRVTRALNDEIAARNALAENQERADREAADAAQARYDRDMAAADTDRARYDETLRAADEARRRYELELADWRATVDACQRGDRARCAAGSMPVRTPPY
jgi:hypothetical protein